MISSFREFSRSKWAVALFVLIMISFVIVGARMDVFSNLGPKHVIDAGERTMDEATFRSSMDRVRANLQEQAGRPVTIEDMVAENIHTRFLESQTQQLGFLNWAWKAGVRPGQALIIKQIRQIPAFFNSVTGQFDQEQYQQALAQQNVTAAQLEQDLRDQYVIEHFGAAVFAGARVPRVYGALLAGQAFESRDGRWFEVTQAMAGTAPQPTDAQLTAFINENAARLRSPELRIASVVLFTPDEAARTAPISEQRIQERFEFKKATLGQPERRTFVTLTAPNREIAARIAAALRAGQTPENVGRANSLQPATFTDQPRSAVGDQAVAAAVFGLQNNQVSDPIQAGVGFAVAKVTGIQPGQEATLDNARQGLIQELREEDAKGATYGKVEAYEKARSEGRNLADAARQVGARIVQLPPFTQDGKLPNGQALNAPPQIFETAWGLSKGGESDVVDAGQGQYFAVRVDDVRPAALPTLNEVRAPLTTEWLRRENLKRITARANELAGRVRAGEDIAAVARSANATLTVRTGVVRNPETTQALGQGLIQGLFGQGKGQVFVQPASETAVAVGRVDEVRAASPAIAGPLAEQVRPRITSELVQAMVEGSLTAGAASSKAKNDPAAARRALGLSDQATPTSPATTPAAK
ncbi:peptidylprolyl isomerase [Brevundimonas sp. PAMC22021]|uniref:peptidylprolyl isomerase n=1 Tax=Brevundimonas sp. PAMC22021 TaxID=2861285 RepID=UPI001C63625C|nr:peptidylprolyl isomerase [Brevundimonas sp. PAMC22021]QYF87936.1 SurA N-terminal domain-containing protein [Brevundimonas sp. PAMC22021]